MRMNAKELIAEARVTAPTLPPAAAKLMTAMADRLDVQFAALCESRNEAKQLAGENALMKSAIKTHSESVHFCVGCGKDDPCSNDDVCYALEETPATDAFLASLRAEGAEMLRQHPAIQLCSLTHVCDEVAAQLRSQSATSPAPLSAAITDIIAERQRQQSVEGWTPEHDEQHTSGELAGAAACYARHVNGRQWVYPTRPESYASEKAPNEWPWHEEWWKPTNPRRDLVKAGAFIAAEIERIDRAAQLRSKSEVQS